MTRALADHLAPDSVGKLLRAARARFEDAEVLGGEGRRLGALYLYGYVVEMCLAAAYFRSNRFRPTTPIHDETRRLHMVAARQQQLMSSDPHPLDGWARLLRWQRTKLGVKDERHARLLRESVARAEEAYRHWRPRLRYNTCDVSPAQLEEVRRAAEWLLANEAKL